MVFKDPWVIACLPVVLGVIIFVKRKQALTSIRFPSTGMVTALKPTWKVRCRKVPYLLRLLAITLLFIALAAPRSILEETVHEAKGIDIVIAIDSSYSMAAEDFVMNGQRQNRLAVVKNVVKEFIDERKDDRIGLVTFAGLAYTVSPLTTDYGWLLKNLERVELGLIKDGTAIGSAIVSSVSRLRKSDAKSKVIILLTDGKNNSGKMDPVAAARVAQAYGIKIYSIGAGTNGAVPFPQMDAWGRKFYRQAVIELDEQVLKDVAEITNGKYYLATDTESLRKIYNEIDKLEKVKIKDYGYREYKELFGFFVMGALAIMCIEIFLRNTVLLKLP